ncbi:hypothetical protein C0581_02830 [Candidatus Parcubacteria bacterium]|nr:MAG: hypothetical protein C0581_02830 [Candidatus Parcubacteria bacterium]
MFPVKSTGNICSFHFWRKIMKTHFQIVLESGEILVVLVRHAKYGPNGFSPEETEKIRKQGQCLLELGLDPSLIVTVIASIRERSQVTATLLLEGMGITRQILISLGYDALDEIGEHAPKFKAASKDAGSPPWVMLSEAKGDELCEKFQISSRLVRALNLVTVCQTSTQIAGEGRVVVISAHNGNNLEIALEAMKLQSQGIRLWSNNQLPSPQRYIQEAGVVLVFLNAQTGLLSDRADPIVYLDAE